MTDLEKMKEELEKTKEQIKKDKERIKDLRDGILTKMYSRLRNEQWLAGTTFKVKTKYKNGWKEGEIISSGLSNNLIKLWKVAEATEVGSVYLHPTGFEKIYYNNKTVSLLFSRNMELKLSIGENISQCRLKAVIQEFGIKIDIAGVNEAIQKVEQSKGVYSRSKADDIREWKRKLVLSGAVEGIPVSQKFPEFLEIEEEFARHLHSTFARMVRQKDNVGELRNFIVAFDHMEKQDQLVFLELGRVMYKQYQEEGC